MQEKRVLEIHNESIDADEKRQSLRIAQMEDSDIYKKIHTEDCVKLTDNEWRALEKLLDQTFNNFTARLKKSYPKISYKEIQVCYLTKIKLSSTKMTKILRYNSSPLRSRLYKKSLRKLEAFRILIRLSLVFNSIQIRTGPEQKYVLNFVLDFLPYLH